MRMTKVYPITKVLPQEWEEWLEKFEAEGWHLEKVSLGGYINENQRPEAFTDMDSLVSRNNKLISLYFACFLPYFSLIPMFIRDGGSPFKWGFISIVSILLVVGISRLFYANKKLKKV